MSLPEPSHHAYLGPYLSTLPQNARLLVQAGATDGALARKYRANYPASSWLVADADAAQAQQAREYADRVHQVDLEHAGDTFYKHLEWADGWIFDGTLEQLQEPGKVLAQVRKVIQCDACIVARIANARYWNAPAAQPRQHLGIDGILALFEQHGFRVVNGVMLNPAPLPPAVADALQLRAAQTGVPLDVLIDDAQPSHYLIKAMPA
ncbi:hypothetical protein [Duganella violaceipulchra]|uniref:Uncharacterized protein n=1 Tax=Duganella violaceipulchra TaxID=2849652 RepID=A0AA41HK93_9BURK|nr:hypothetical protein [Duganella violaceicalia]MBV6325671.1 hypothetical protein [Duganella violaceicalia]MCP2012763.1 hypothetical protein [Duganella violaceicalia]